MKMKLLLNNHGLKNKAKVSPVNIHNLNNRLCYLSWEFSWIFLLKMNMWWSKHMWRHQFFGFIFGNKFSLYYYTNDSISFAILICGVVMLTQLMPMMQDTLHSHHTISKILYQIMLLVSLFKIKYDKNSGNCFTHKVFNNCLLLNSKYNTIT